MALSRCRQCNATLKSDELDCYACGSEVPQVDDRKVAFARRFAAIANGLFFLFAGLSVVSLFVDFPPGLVPCLTSTFVMLFVRSSATQMLEKTTRQ